MYGSDRKCLAKMKCHSLDGTCMEPGPSLLERMTRHCFHGGIGPFYEVKQIAFDILSIPATSADMERVFSMSRRMITDDHHRMTDDHGGHNDAGILVEEGIDHARPVDR